MRLARGKQGGVGVKCLLARKDFLSLSQHFPLASKLFSFVGIVGLIKFINNKVDYIINDNEVTFLALFHSRSRQPLTVPAQATIDTLNCNF